MLTPRLVKHRIASYSQQSQRYVKVSNFAYVIHPSIERDIEMKQEYISIMEKMQAGYNRLLERFEVKGIKGKSLLKAPVLFYRKVLK